MTTQQFGKENNKSSRRIACRWTKYICECGYMAYSMKMNISICEMITISKS